MIIATYYASKQHKQLEICRLVDGKITVLRTIPVDNKSDARRVAAAQGAKCWNF